MGRTGELSKLIAKRFLSRSEALAQFRDVTTSRLVLPHGGSVNWNAFRKRWVMIFVESGDDQAAQQQYGAVTKSA